MPHGGLVSVTSHGAMQMEQPLSLISTDDKQWYVYQGPMAALGQPFPGALARILVNSDLWQIKIRTPVVVEMPGENTPTVIGAVIKGSWINEKKVMFARLLLSQPMLDAYVDAVSPQGIWPQIQLDGLTVENHETIVVGNQGIIMFAPTDIRAIYIVADSPSWHDVDPIWTP